MTISDQEVWLRAYCAAIVNRPTYWDGCTIEWAGAAASFALSDFRERFPVEPVPEVKGCATCGFCVSTQCRYPEQTRPGVAQWRNSTQDTGCPGWSGGEE